MWWRDVHGDFHFVTKSKNLDQCEMIVCLDRGVRGVAWTKKSEEDESHLQ